MSKDLVAFIRPDETALQLFARSYIEPVPTGVFFLGSLRPGQILEVAGPSGSGKTTVLIQVAVNTILPRAFAGQSIGGLQENVLMVDLDNKFDILRLMAMLNARIQPALAAIDRDADGEALDTIMNACLQRFHLIRCGCSFEVLAVLKTVRRFITSLQGGQGIHVMLLDNVAAFYWPDSVVRPISVLPRQASSALTLQVVHSILAAELRLLAKQFKLAVIATKHSFRAAAPSGREDEDLSWQHRESMGKIWVEAVSQRILLRHLAGGVGDLPSHFGAKWDKPQHRNAQTFAISDEGIVMSAW